MQPDTHPYACVHPLPSIVPWHPAFNLTCASACKHFQDGSSLILRQDFVEILHKMNGENLQDYNKYTNSRCNYIALTTGEKLQVCFPPYPTFVRLHSMVKDHPDMPIKKAVPTAPTTRHHRTTMILQQSPVIMVTSTDINQKCFVPSSNCYGCIPIQFDNHTKTCKHFQEVHYFSW